MGECMHVVYEYLRPEGIRQDGEEDDVSQLNSLLRQLTTNPVPLDRDRLAEVCGNSLLLVVKVNGVILGMNTLSVLHRPTGNVGVVEDVVVDECLRGAGVGRELVGRLIERAVTGQLVDRIELTCHPGRTRANALYTSLGFERRETNNYTMKLKSQQAR